jgi:site-specific recombinase XerD
MKRLITRRHAPLPTLSLEAAELAAHEYARGSRAAATWRAYEADWKAFLAWCQSVEQAVLPATPTTVALFLAAQATLGFAPSTLGRRLAAIRLMHVGARLSSPHDAIEVG